MEDEIDEESLLDTLNISDGSWSLQESLFSNETTSDLKRMIIKIYRRIIEKINSEEIEKQSVPFLFENQTILKFAEFLILKDMKLITSTLLILIDIAPHKPEVWWFSELMESIHFHISFIKPKFSK